MSITAYDNATYLFPETGNSTRFLLFGIFKTAQQIAFYSVRVEFYIAFFGILLTTFHIIILSRKSMMTSSVISIMIGIAIFDMTSMIITIGTNHMLYNTEGSEWLIFSYYNQSICAPGHLDPGRPDPGHPDPGHPHPGHPDPGHPDPGHPDPGHPDPGHPDPGHPDPGHPDPGHPDPDYPDPGHPDPGHPDPGHPDPGYPDPGHPDPGHPDPGHPDPGHPDPGHPDPGHPDPDYPDPGHPDPGYPDPGHPDPGHPDPGTPPATLFSFHVFWFFISVRDLVRRSATWLGVLMAFIRYAGLKFALNATFQKLTKPILGVHAIVISVIPSFLLSIFYWMRYDFVNSETDIWKPMEGCKNYAPEISRPIVNQKASRFFTDNHGIVGKVYMLLNGTVSKILPCILLPILTILLAIELQKAKNVRKNLGGSGREKSTERTTVLVIFMALSFFIAELPIGTALALQVAYTDIGFLFLATFVNHMCNALFTINSITHCLIFFVMSSQYRKTVSMYTGFPKLEMVSRNTVLSTAKRSSY